MEKKITYIIAILALMAISFAPKQTFVLQYVVDNELITETFNTTKEYNQRVKELKINGIICYL